MTPEAKKILNAFRQRGIRAGGNIALTNSEGDDFIQLVRSLSKETAPDPLKFLFDEGYLKEYLTLIELTELGDKYLYDLKQPKYGARVYGLGDIILIKQTVLRGTPPEYVIDEQRERHVNTGDDAAIAEAIRAAVKGLM